MKKKSQGILDLFLRYIILILVAIPNLWLFYFIFTPLTVYPVNFLLSLSFNSSINGNTITLLDNFSIHLIPACIAGSAYYLLLVINLVTPKINFKKRIGLILFSFTPLLILNIFRIFILSLMFVSGSTLFDATHKLFWYLLSTLFVVGIWFTEVKLFKIKEIPFYSDLKFLYKKIK
jgi:exosortase/archaeosortase family protein